MLAARQRIGIDLVSIPRAARLTKERAFLERAFHPSEVADTRIEHLAGVLAAKEAFFKAVGIGPDWLAVEVIMAASGRPSLRLGGSLGHLAIQDLDLSISHEGDYAVAAVVLLLGEEPEP
ncbi:MAG: 4'-phosphopantetheinyl transferase superfamily protein [Chloroflexi bacterium]|nr:4'-phosphopantetheinyl transferase superfamily protein [Chloroflexota bacterium]